MKQFVKDKITLLQCDCLDYMKDVPDKHYSLALVDPPYFKECEKEIFPGAAISTTRIKRNRFKSNHWELPTDDYFKELFRVSQNQIIWGINYFNVNGIGSGRIIWDKKNDKSSFSKAEIAYCSIHKSVQIFRYMWNGMLQENMKDKEMRIHPTQKPIALYKWLLRNYATPDMKIIDTHGGSMSSMIACHAFGCEAVCCEIDEDYFDAGVKRFDNETRQLTIF